MIRIFLRFYCIFISHRLIIQYAVTVLVTTLYFRLLKVVTCFKAEVLVKDRLYVHVRRWDFYFWNYPSGHNIIGPSQPVHSLPHNDAFTVSHTRWFAWIRIFVPLHRPLPWSWQPCRVQPSATMEDVSRSLNRCDLKSLSNNIRFSCCVSLKHCCNVKTSSCWKLGCSNNKIQLLWTRLEVSICKICQRCSPDWINDEAWWKLQEQCVCGSQPLSLIQFGPFSSAGIILAQPCRCWNITTVFKWDYII